LIADPGYQLVRDARQADMTVLTAPGPAACIAALTVAGLPTDQFHFAGFLPPQQTARQKALVELMPLRATLVLYESPKRLNALLMDIESLGGSARHVAVCRELTKKFEELRRGTLAELAESYSTGSVKGEVVLLIDRGDLANVNEVDLDGVLKEALETMSMRDAVDAVSQAHGKPRRQVYQLALNLGK
jgi:16S rRNA (cytidine1402-2'-O)-methyltransferase